MVNAKGKSSKAKGKRKELRGERRERSGEASKVHQRRIIGKTD